MSRIRPAGHAALNFSADDCSMQIVGASVTCSDIGHAHGVYMCSRELYSITDEIAMLVVTVTTVLIGVVHYIILL